MLACCVLASSLACAPPSHAEEAPAVAVLRQGEAAPFAGFLLTRPQMEEAAQQMTWLRLLLETHQMEMQTLREQLTNLKETHAEEKRIAVETAERKKDLEIAEYVKRDNQKTKRIFDLENPPWYRTSEWNRIFGAVAVVVGGFLIRGF